MNRNSVGGEVYAYYNEGGRKGGGKLRFSEVHISVYTL